MVLHATMVPQEAKRTRHRSNESLLFREFQVQSLLQERRQRGLLFESDLLCPLILIGPEWNTHEDDEVICIPQGYEHRTAATPTAAVVVAVLRCSPSNLSRIGTKRRRVARPHVSLVSLVDRTECDIREQGR